MNLLDAITHIIDVLQPAVGEQEAKNISRIILEDAFALTYPFDSGEVDKEKLEIILTKLRVVIPFSMVLGSAHFYGFDLRVNEHVCLSPGQKPRSYFIRFLSITKIGQDH